MTALRKSVIEELEKVPEDKLLDVLKEEIFSELAK